MTARYLLLVAALLVVPAIGQGAESDGATNFAKAAESWIGSATEDMWLVYGTPSGFYDLAKAAKKLQADPVAYYEWSYFDKQGDESYDEVKHNPDFAFRREIGCFGADHWSGEVSPTGNLIAKARGYYEAKASIEAGFEQSDFPRQHCRILAKVVDGSVMDVVVDNYGCELQEMFLYACSRFRPRTALKDGFPSVEPVLLLSWKEIWGDVVGSAAEVIAAQQLGPALNDGTISDRDAFLSEFQTLLDDVLGWNAMADTVVRDIVESCDEGLLETIASSLADNAAPVPGSAEEQAYGQCLGSAVSKSMQMSRERLVRAAPRFRALGQKYGAGTK